MKSYRDTYFFSREVKALFPQNAEFLKTGCRFRLLQNLLRQQEHVHQYPMYISH